MEDELVDSWLRRIGFSSLSDLNMLKTLLADPKISQIAVLPLDFEAYKTHIGESPCSPMLKLLVASAPLNSSVKKQQSCDNTVGDRVRSILDEFSLPVVKGKDDDAVLLDSLSVLQIARALEREFCVQVDILALFGIESVRRLSDYLQSLVEMKMDRPMALPLVETSAISFRHGFAIPSQTARWPESGPEATRYASKGDTVAMLGGGHALPCLSSLESIGCTVSGSYKPAKFLAPRKEDRVLCGDILELDERHVAEEDLVITAVGSNNLRLEIVRRFASRLFITVVDPTCSMHSSVNCGNGTLISAGAVIEPLARIGRHCIIGANVVIGHETTVEDFSFVAAGSAIGGRCFIARGSFLALGCRVLPGVQIGRGATIGAGVVVRANVRADELLL
jgi:sugar O-acyltransferase (sialic acid O-acetyltransferase NeuD family)